MRLERFDGHVDEMGEGNKIAMVTVISRTGKRLSGPYPAKALRAVGLTEGDRFVLETVGLPDGSTGIEITPAPHDAG
jgi:hypothetical protein